MITSNIETNHNLDTGCMSLGEIYFTNSQKLTVQRILYENEINDR